MDARLPRYPDLISAAARLDQRQATFSIAVLALFTICLFASAFLLFLVMAPAAENLGGIPGQPTWRVLQANPNDPVWTDDFSDVLSVTRLT